MGKKKEEEGGRRKEEEGGEREKGGGEKGEGRRRRRKRKKMMTTRKDISGKLSAYKQESQQLLESDGDWLFTHPESVCCGHNRTAGKHDMAKSNPK